MKKLLLLFVLLFAFFDSRSQALVPDSLKTKPDLEFGLVVGATSLVCGLTSHFIFSSNPSEKTFRNGFTYISGGLAIVSVILLLDSSHRFNKESKVKFTGNGVTVNISSK